MAKVNRGDGDGAKRKGKKITSAVLTEEHNNSQLGRDVGVGGFWDPLYQATQNYSSVISITSTTTKHKRQTRTKVSSTVSEII